ncbi:MAG TPA: glycosyltransferase family A protein [Moheibacter sp.]|nr:glycosyltransferase family A protein [Moheibacter sp.]
MDLNHCIIIPAKNEADFIGKTLESIVNQSRLPKELIVVDDHSTDQTREIVQEFVQRHDFIQLVSSKDAQEAHLPGAKIIQAFYDGLAHAQQDWDLISKFDADVILPKNYLEKLHHFFQQNPQTGIAGGKIYIFKEGAWIFEKIAKSDHVRGAIKTYSKACFQKIGGPRRSIGWDTADEILALFYGFEIKVLNDLSVKLLKPTGTVYQAIHGQKIGQSFYRLDYGCCISGIAAAKASWNKKSFPLFFEIAKGYFQAWKNDDPKMFNPAEGKFARAFRWQGIFAQLKKAK